MDYDSSTKFISSLAKFLQSLCNGYVEFDNGVEVIGHIYLSVDTGKKIDYILNEKVCKTDENSVTFISNSFHAQPAEKPKPNAKKGKNDQTDDKTDNVVEIDNDSSQVEPKSTNLGTIPRNSNKNPYSPSQRHGKRPFSPHSKSNSSPGSKRSKNESQEYSAGIISDEGTLPTSPAPDPLRGFTQGSVSLPSDSNFSDSYDQGFHPSVDNSFADESEERDIKPTMDTDVTFVKEEFTPSSSQLEDDRNQGGVDAPYSSLYPSYSGEGPSNQTFGQQNSRLSFGGAGDRSDVYDPGMRSHMEGNGSGTDASAFSTPKRRRTRKSALVNKEKVKKRRGRRPAVESFDVQSPTPPDSKSLESRTCFYCGKTYSRKSELTRHHWKCQGLRILPCEMCDAMFHRKDHLRKHLERHFGKDFVPMKPDEIVDWDETKPIDLMKVKEENDYAMQEEDGYRTREEDDILKVKEEGGYAMQEEDGYGTREEDDILKVKEGSENKAGE